MRRLIALKKINSEQGFNLLEMVLVSVIVGITAAVGVPNLIGSQRNTEAKQAFSSIQSALTEAQTNAIRISTTCKLTITETSITATPNGCISESITIGTNIGDDINSNAVTISSSLSFASPTITEVEFNFDGSNPVSSQQTITIARNDFSGNALNSSARCIVIANTLGMIRTGVVNSSGGCNNLENLKYTP